MSGAWYRDYNADLPQAAISMPILASPSTCPLCVNGVVESLDQYRSSAASGVVDDATPTACTCRDAWLESIADAAIDLGAIGDAYAAAGSAVMGQQWWAVHGGIVLGGSRLVSREAP